MTEGFAELKYSHQRTPDDGLLLPGNMRVGEVQTDQLARVLVDLGIPGASFSQGRIGNIEAYKKFVAGIERDAAKVAVAKWLAEQ